MLCLRRSGGVARGQYRRHPPGPEHVPTLLEEVGTEHVRCDYAASNEEAVSEPTDLAACHQQWCEVMCLCCSWVASHDPVGMEDRQITLLESLSVNIEQVRAAVDTVNDTLKKDVRRLSLIA